MDKTLWPYALVVLMGVSGATATLTFWLARISYQSILAKMGVHEKEVARLADCVRQIAISQARHDENRAEISRVLEKIEKRMDAAEESLKNRRPT